ARPSPETRRARFEQTLGGLAGHDAFLLLGPDPAVRASIEAGCRALGRTPPVLLSQDDGRCTREVVLRSLAVLYARGLEVRWSEVFRETGEHVDLPGYPWQRERCWLPAVRPQTDPSR